MSFFAAARLEKEWIASLAQDRTLNCRASTATVCRAEALAERRQRAPPPPARSGARSCCAPSLDAPAQSYGRGARPSGLAADRRYTSSSQFSDRAALHTYRLVTAAAELGNSSRMRAFPDRAANSPSHRHETAVPAGPGRVEPQPRVLRLNPEGVRNPCSPAALGKGFPSSRTPRQGTKKHHEHGRAFICVACSDPAVAHRTEGERTAIARPRVGERAQVAGR